MTDEEINEIVTRILHARLDEFGFIRAKVASELDFDGGPIIRVLAEYQNGQVPSGRLIESLEDIRSELIRRGEERFVFLDREYPKEEKVDEDSE